MKRLVLIAAAVAVLTGCGYVRAGKLNHQLEALQDEDNAHKQENLDLRRELVAARQERDRVRVELQAEIDRLTGELEALKSMPRIMTLEGKYFPAMQACYAALGGNASPEGFAIRLEGERPYCSFPVR